MEEKKEELKSVQIENFIYTLNGDDGFISVASVSGNWYVGYAPGCMMHTLLYSYVFSDDAEHNEEEKSTITNVVTSLYCTCNIVDSEFTIKLFDAIEDFTKKNAEKNVDVNSEEQQEESEKAIENVKTMAEIQEQIEEDK